MKRLLVCSGLLLLLTVPAAIGQTSGAQSGEPGTAGYQRGEVRSGIRPGFGAERGHNRNTPEARTTPSPSPGRNALITGRVYSPFALGDGVVNARSLSRSNERWRS